MSIDEKKLKSSVEAILMTASKPYTAKKILALFDEEENVTVEAINHALAQLQEDYQDRGVGLIEVASGYRFQARAEYAPHIAKSLEERPAKYSRALLETLALIAYRQPITRADVEDIRGVSVSTGMVKTLLERDWVRVVGHKDVPGKPALYATTRTFLDYFNLASLEELPSLADIKSLDEAELKANGLELDDVVNENIDDMVSAAAEALAESIAFVVAITPELDAASNELKSEQEKGAMVAGKKPNSKQEEQEMA